MENDVISTLNGVYTRVLPEIILVVTACIVFLGGTVRANRHIWAAVSFMGIVLAGAFIPVSLPDSESVKLFVSPIYSDSLAQFFRWLSLSLGILFVFLFWNQISDKFAGELFGCLLIVLAGLSLTCAANDLITLFIALEMISIPTYIMLYLPKTDSKAQEAALKYFMLSVFSSALLLFGFSYLYGMTGTTNLSVILHSLNQVSSQESLPIIGHLAMIMIVAGLGFKITAVPFHFYAPDVYQGTSDTMAAFLAVVPKVAGFVAIVRVFGLVLPSIVPTSTVNLGMGLSSQTPILLWFLAAITMTLGNVFALLQTNLKRILAYSSVAHAGYMLVALAAVPYLNHLDGDIIHKTGPRGVDAVLYYLIAYASMTIGVFAVLALVNKSERPVETIDDLAGLGQTHPAIGLMMTVFLFSLIGIPFTAGFTGKLYIFFDVISITNPVSASGTGSNPVVLFRVLALIAAVNAAIGAWYYLRMISVMFLRGAVEPVKPGKNLPGLITIILCVVLTVGLSIPPGATWVFKWVKLDRISESN